MGRRTAGRRNNARQLARQGRAAQLRQLTKETAKEVGVFGKDLALDTAGELLDLSVATLASLGTLTLYEPEPGEFNPRRRRNARRSR